MSYSSGIGHDVQEETNGTDSPDSPEACSWTAANGSTSLVQKTCRDGVAFLEQDKQEGTPETCTPTAHSTYLTCRQIHTNSAPHTNTPACEDGVTHTDEHTSHSQPVNKDSPYMETVNTPHTQTHDGWGGGEEKENQNSESDGEEVEYSQENQQAADITVQVRLWSNVSAKAYY